MFNRRNKDYNFLATYKKSKDVFIKPKLKWYFGLWKNEHNLPVWRRGNTIHFGKWNERIDKYNWALLESSEWNELGKENHPILSKIIKPSYELPRWLSFYFFNSDIVWKTKWSEDDFRYEYPSHFGIIFFGLCFSLTAYIPKEYEKDYTCQDDYWESILTYQYYDGDLEKTNERMGYYNSLKDSNFRFCFNPRFLKNEEDRNKLKEIQAKKIIEIAKDEEEKEKNRTYGIYADIINTNEKTVDGIYKVKYNDKVLIYKKKDDCEKVLNNLKKVQYKKNGILKDFNYKMYIGDKDSFLEWDSCNLYKSAIIDKNINILENIDA